MWGVFSLGNERKGSTQASKRSGLEARTQRGEGKKEGMMVGVGWRKKRRMMKNMEVQLFLFLVGAFSFREGGAREKGESASKSRCKKRDGAGKLRGGKKGKKIKHTPARPLRKKRFSLRWTGQKQIWGQRSKKGRKEER